MDISHRLQNDLCLEGVQQAMTLKHIGNEACIRSCTWEVCADYEFQYQ